MKYKLLFFILVSLSISLKAQVQLDSLWSIWIDETKEDTSRLEALNDFIYSGYIKTKNDSALYYAQIHFEFAEENGLKEYSADALDNMARAHIVKGEFSEAIEYTQRSLEIYKEVGNKKEWAYAMFRVAQIRFKAGDYEEAKEYYHNCLEIVKEIEDKKWEYQCLSGIAYSFYQQGQFNEAIKYIQKCLKLSEEIKYESGIAWSLNAISSIYENQGNKEKSLEYCLKSLEVSEKIGNNRLASYTMYRIGDIYFDFGDKVKAKSFYERGLGLAEGVNDKRSISTALQGLGRIHEHHGEMEKALENYKKSLSLAEEIGDQDAQSEFLDCIGQAQLIQGNYNLGIEACQDSYDIAIKVGSFDDQLRACKCLYKGYKALGKYFKALAFHEEMLVLEDSLNFKALTHNLQEMEYTRQLFADSLQHEEDKLKVELAYQTELRNKKRTQNVFLVFGLIILLIALGLWNRMRFTKKANAQLKIERDRAEHSELVKHQFLANMSHEIRTPMNAIKGMIDILIRRKPKAEQVNYLENVKEASNSLLVIINDILDLSKIESGKVELECIPFSIPEMLKNVYTIMQFKAEEKGLELKLDIPATIPSVMGDPMRLRQVMINLIGNAIKFTEKGIVNTKIILDSDKKNSIINAHFIVSDTGIGIDEDKVEQVFNSFEQAYADTSRKFGGTGLGLTISRKLIEMHDGKIWVESTKGAGSQFHFTIPFKVNTDTEKVDKESESIDIGRISDQLQGIKVLLVEDNAFNVVVAKEELEDAIKGVSVNVAENGAIAIEQVRNDEFDIILMDVQMPVMNGYDATIGIRNLSDDKSSIPIIAMTANVLKEEVALCYKAGMNDFIGKPFEIEILLQKIYSLTKA